METYDETMEYNRQAKRDFAAVGRAWFFYFAVSLAAAFLSSFVAGIVGGEWLESDWGLYMVGLVIPYLFAFPVFFLLIRRKAAPGTFSPEKKKLPFRSLLKWFCIAQFLMVLGNLLGLFWSTVIEMLTGAETTTTIDLVSTSDMLPVITMVVLLAPIVEELVFRKYVIDRMYPYGEKTAIFLSATVFALMHGNLNQVFYAFFLGCAQGYLYCKTRDVRYTICIHMMVNFVGSVLPLFAQNFSDMAMVVVVIIDFVIGIAGLVFLLTDFARNQLWLEEGEIVLPEHKRISITWLNKPFMIFTWIYLIGAFVSNYILPIVLK